MSKKSRSFCFTINNYNELELNQLKDIVCKYIIIGDEIGESGTPHLQGYISFVNPISFESLKRQMPRAHISVANGTAEQNTQYCSKEKIIYQYGIMPKSGKRTDLDEIRLLIASGSGMKDIVNVAL